MRSICDSVLWRPGLRLSALKSRQTLIEHRREGLRRRSPRGDFGLQTVDASVSKQSALHTNTIFRVLIYVLIGAG